MALLGAHHILHVSRIRVNFESIKDEHADHPDKNVRYPTASNACLC